MEALLSNLSFSEMIVENLMSHRTHLSYSSLSAFGESPKDFINYKIRKREQTDAMAYGSMVHCLVLEPDDFENRYLAFDDTDFCESLKAGGAKSPRATNAYKDWYAQQEAGLGDRIMVSPVEFNHAKIVAGNVIHNRASAAILRMCPNHEKAIEWIYQNFLFKGFIDLDGDSAICDLKTCADAEPRKFQREVVNMDYHLQAAMYIKADMLLRNTDRMKDFYWIAVDKKGGVSAHQADKHLLESGMERYEKLISSFNECILSDRWDESYDYWSERWDGIYKAEKPSWMY